jgi:hypothetical protein
MTWPRTPDWCCPETLEWVAEQIDRDYRQARHSSALAALQIKYPRRLRSRAALAQELDTPPPACNEGSATQRSRDDE